LNSEITVTFIEKKTKKEAIVKFKKEINSSSWEMKVKNPDNELFSLDKKELKNSFESMKEKIDAL
jgi:ribosomal protein L31E